MDEQRITFDQGDADRRTRLLVRRDGRVSFFPVMRSPSTTESPPLGQSPTEATAADVSATATTPLDGISQDGST